MLPKQVRTSSVIRAIFIWRSFHCLDVYKLKYKRRITRVYVEGEKVIQKRVFILVICILLHVGEAQSSVKTRHNEKHSHRSR